MNTSKSSDDFMKETTDLESKLNLEPFPEYDENIHAVESVIDGDYDVVYEAAMDMDPRVAHEVFRYFDRDEDYLDEIVDTLEEQEPLEGWRKTLFDTGYRSGYPDFSNLDRTWRANHPSDRGLPGEDEIPVVFRAVDQVFNGPLPVVGWYSHGKQKRAADGHYARAFEDMIMDIGEEEL